MEKLEQLSELAAKLDSSESMGLTLFEQLLEVAGQVLRMCNGDRTITNMMIEKETMKAVTDVCRYCATSQSHSSTDTIAADGLVACKQKLILRLCRLVSNFCACGTDAREHWKELNQQIESWFQPLSHVLSAAVVANDRQSVAAAMSGIYNLLHGNGNGGEHHQTNTADASCLQNFCSCRPILCQLLLALLPGTNDQNKATAAAQQNAEDPAIQWFHMLAFLWTRRGLLLNIYETVAPTAKLEVRFTVTHEQLILLQLTIAVMEDTYCTDILFSSAASDKRLGEDQVVGGGTLAGAKVVEGLLVGVAMDLAVVKIDGLFASAKEQPLEQGDAVETALAKIELRMQHGLVQDFVPLALQLLASTLSVLPAREGQALRTRLVQDTTLLEWVVRLLCANFAHKSSVRAGGQRETIPAQPSEGKGRETSPPPPPPPPPPPSAAATAALVVVEDVERLRECARIALRLLGNLVYGCDAAKDALRTSGALAAVLSHCGTDFENPLSREWALLCVRNACEGHADNQSFIDSLRPQEVVIQDERLKAHGVKVEMNPETGKFKFVRPTG